MVNALRYVGKYGISVLSLFALAVFFGHVPGESWLETARNVGSFALQAGFLFCAAAGFIVGVMEIVDHYRNQ